MTLTDAQRYRARRLDLFELGAATMTPDELEELSCHLRHLASDAEEVRFLQLERRAQIKAEIPNRPTIGYYLAQRDTLG